MQEYGLQNTPQQVNSHFFLGGMPQANEGYCKQKCFYVFDINGNILKKKKVFYLILAAYVI